MNGSSQSKKNLSSIDTDMLKNVLTNNQNNSYKIVKNENECMVIKTPDCFYKIRKLNKQNPTCSFEQTVIQALCSEYKEMGLVWDVFKVKQNNTSYLVEKRQELKVLSPGDYNIREAINKSSKIIRRVEKRLEISLLAAQVKLSGLFEQFSKIVLARDSHNNYEDFAIWQDQIILLGNSNWFLAMLDNSGRWNTCQSAKPVAITLSYGEFYFNMYDTFNQVFNALDIFKESSKWWLFEKSELNLIETRESMKSNLENMIQSNIEVATNKLHKHVSTEDEFGTMLEECKKA